MTLLLTVLFALAAAAQQNEPPKPLIAGHVTSAATGLPLGKAEVILHDRQGAEETTEVTASGSFEFRDLEPGTYHLSAGCPGYVTSRFAVISVAVDRPAKNVEIKLTRYGVLTGRVLDEDGRPLASANVRVLEAHFNAEAARRGLRPIRTASTDDLGRYRLWGLPPGRYYLLAEYRENLGADAPDETYAITFYPGVTDLPAAAPIEVLSGLETGGIDIKLIRTRVFRVRGRVIDSTSAEPRPPLTIRLVSPSRLQQVSANANTDGSFEFRGVGPGAYRLIAARWTPAGVLRTSDEIEVTDSNLTNLVLTLAKPFELPGSATVEGRPDFRWPEVHLSLRVAGENFGTAGASIRQDGTFTLQDIAPGRYRIETSAWPGTDLYLKSAHLGADDVLDADLDLQHAPSPSARLDLVFSPRVAHLSGTVLDDDNKPVPGAFVVLLTDPAHRDSWNRHGFARADQDGAYSITIRPGDYQAAAFQSSDPNDWRDPEFAGKLEANSVPISLAEDSREVRNLKLTR